MLPVRAAGLVPGRRVGSGVQHRFDNRSGSALLRRRVEGGRSRFVPCTHPGISFDQSGDNARGRAVAVPERDPRLDEA